MLAEQQTSAVQPPSEPNPTIIRNITSPEELGYALRTARFERGITQTDLSELCEMDRSLISRIETGQANPRVSTISRILCEIACSLSLVIKNPSTAALADSSTSSEEGQRVIRGLIGAGQLGRALRTARRERTMRQVDLCDICGVSRTHISRIESGKDSPRVGTISRILDGLACSLSLSMGDVNTFDLYKHFQSYGLSRTNNDEDA